VADVEVGLGAVLGDEHLTVLEGVHRARIHVQVRIQLLHDDPEAAGSEELAQAGGRQTLAQRGRNPAGDEKMTRRARLHGSPGYIRTSRPGQLPRVSPGAPTRSGGGRRTPGGRL